MKRIVHYAGDPPGGDAGISSPIKVPHCRWFRVRDIDVVGESWASRPLPELVSEGLMRREPATITIDDRKPQPLYALEQFESNTNRYYESFSLTGNVEIEYGEAHEPPPGPMRRHRIDTPGLIELASGLDPGNINDNGVIMLPKGAQSLSLTFFGGGVNLTTIVVKPVYLFSNGAFAGSGQFTHWREGAFWGAPNRGAKQIFSLGQRMFDWTGNALNVSLHLGPGFISSDDLPNQSYVRPWAPSAGIAILTLGGDAAAQIWYHIRGND